MSFLKGIFGKDQKPAATTPHGKAAPPARPFPAGFSADGQQQQRRPSAYDQQHYPPAHLQQQPIQSGPSATDQPSTGGGGGGGGMDDFDLFDGLSLKVATPAHGDSQPPSQPASAANGHASGPHDEAATSPAADVAAAPSDHGGAADPMDMFSGLTVASDDMAPAVGPDETSSGGDGGGSLLSMLNADDSAPAVESQPAEASSFSFVSESAAQPTEASSFSFVSESAAQPADDAPADSGSSFGFLSSSTEDVAPSYDSHADADAPQTDRKMSVGDYASTSMDAHTSPSKTHDSHPATPSAGAAMPAQPSAIPAATPAASKSSAAPTFEQVHGEVDAALTSYWDNLKSLSLTVSALRTQQIGLQSALKGTQDQIGALEVQQQHEIEAENYEGADQINSQLDALKAQLLADGRELSRIDGAIASQEGSKASLRSRTRDVLDECVRNLQLLSKQHTYQMTHFVTTETQALEHKEDILITNLEKTRRNLQHTATDLAALAKDEEKIAAQIAVDTKEMAEEHAQLQTQLTALEAERDELRRLLQAKEDEVTMCTQKIDVVTTGISSTKAAHDKKLARILEKKTRMQNEQVQATSEEQQLMAAKEALEADFKSIANQEKNSNKRLKKMQEEAAFIQNVVMQKLEHKEEGASAEAGSPTSASGSGSDELESLRSRLASTLSSLESSRAQLSGLDSSLESLNRQIDSVASKIPSLEAAKSTAVASRDFKRAAAVNAEIKSLQTSKAEMETRLGELKAEASALNTQLSELADTKTALTGQIAQVESESDKKRLIAFLQQRMLLNWKNKQVDKLMRKNEQEKEDEAAAAALAGTSAAHAASFALAHHFSYLAHELECNSVEAELLSKEIDELRKKHGWDDAFMQHEAKEQLDERRRANNEPPVDEEEEATSGSAAVDGAAGDAGAVEDEESSISEQRRKDRNAAIAAAAAANAADAAPQADGSQGEVEGETSPKSADATAAAASEEGEQAVQGEDAAAVDVAPAAESTDSAPVAEQDASGSDVAPTDASAPLEPAAPSPPSPSLIASLRSSHASLLAEIESLEADLQRAVESEDFDAAAALDEQLAAKRDDKQRIEKQAEEMNIQLKEEEGTQQEKQEEQEEQPEQEEQQAQQEEQQQQEQEAQE